MNINTISRNVGFALLVSALFMFLSVVVSLVNGHDSALAALIISFLITFIVGAFPFIFVRKTKDVSLKEGYVIIVLSWFLSFVFGMLPYALWGGPFTLANAWFESVSGFTTSGATILENIEALPKSLLFWRSSTHFIGGLGVVVFLLLVIPNSSPMRLRLTNMELSSLSREGYSARANRTVYIFAYVYLGIFALAFLAYWAAGMTAFDALNHAFSVCATGGFSTKNLSIASFDSRLIEGITMLFMMLSSIHFGLIYLMLVTRSVKPLNNPVLKFYLCSVAAVTLVCGLSIYAGGTEGSLWDSLWKGAFHTIAIVTTTGFAIADNAPWPLLANFAALSIGMMCACAGSTTGGMKADRVLVLFKSIGRQIRQILHPSAINEVRLGNKVLRDDEVTPQILYITLYCVVLLVSIILSLACGLEGYGALTGSIASLGNLGPAIGDMGTMGNYNAIPIATKFIFSIDMFLGRIEIYPVLAVVGMMFQTRRK